MNAPFTILVYRAYHAQRNAIRPGYDRRGVVPRAAQDTALSADPRWMYAAELADACDIEPATVSRLLDKMEEDGLVRREVLPPNGPAPAASPSPTGDGAPPRSGGSFAWRRRTAPLRDFSEEGGSRFRAI